MTVEQIGEIKQEFKPGLANLVAGIIIGLLMISGGLAAAYFASNAVIASGGNIPLWTGKGQKGWSWGAAGIFAALGFGLIIGGFFLIRWVRSLFSSRVCIGQNGFAALDKKITRVIGWDDIASVEETHLYQRPPLLKGVAKYALPKLMSKSFIVTLREGEPFAFDGDTIKGPSRLARMIKEETDSRNIPWEIKEEHG